MLTLLLIAQSLVLQPAAEEPANELAGQTTRLVRQLEDRELARREAAEQALIELGPAALEYLPAVDEDATGETAERLARVRLALEQEQARRAAEATQITLQGTYSLEEVLAEFEAQTGNRVIDFRRNFGQQPEALELELDLEEVSFWTALDTVLDMAEMTIYPYPGEPNTLAITNRMEGQVDRLDRGAVAGLFRIEPQMIVASRHLEIPESSSLSLMLQVSWEPRLQPIVIMQSLESIEATDENGNPIEISRQGNREIPVQGASSATEVSIDLEMPGREVQSIASLHGTFEALVPGQIETFEFGDLLEAQNEEVRRAGVVVTLVQARQNGTIFDVRMRVRFDEAGNALESHRGWIFSNEAYLLDGDGNRVLEAGFETLSQGSNEVGMSYKFVPEGDAADCTFVYRTPGALLQMPIEFELTAIPLP